MAAFTVICALELAGYGVRVNAIAPGARTPMTEGAFGRLDFEGDFDPLDPANVAPVVVWLLSDAAAEVSGQVIGITGGLVELYEGYGTSSPARRPPAAGPRGAGRRRPRLFGDRPTRAPWRPSSLRRIIEAARRAGPECGAVGAAGGHRLDPGEAGDRNGGAPVAQLPELLLPHVLGVSGPAAPAGTAAASSSAATRAARRKGRVRMPRSWAAARDRPSAMQ